MSNFLDKSQAQQLAEQHGTPLYVYSQERLQAQAATALAVDAPYGLTVRYAMKANPHPDVLKALQAVGIKIDASSGYEAANALALGFSGNDILLTSQQLAHNLTELVAAGVQFNATSLNQLKAYGKQFPGTNVSVRFNPGIGSGHSAKTTVGGVSSSFGIWHEYVPEVHTLLERYNLNLERLHTHIGSGADPAVWQEAARLTLDLVEQFDTVTIVDVGGGFKVGRLPGEPSTDMREVGRVLRSELEAFHVRTGRQLHLEIEPGTFMSANAGVLMTSVMDIVDTGAAGYNFIKLNTGMNDIMRPTLYGAQHSMELLSDASETGDYVVVGHNCESGDLLSPLPGQPETLGVRSLPRAQIGDLVVIGGAGAYCASMAAHGYNSFPSAKELLV